MWLQQGQLHVLGYMHIIWNTEHLHYKQNLLLNLILSICYLLYEVKFSCSFFFYGSVPS